MILLAISSLFIALLGIALYPIPNVDQLPPDLEEAVTLFSSTIHGLILWLPWLETPFTIFLLGVFIAAALWLIDKLMWILQLLRG